jgi:peptidoglycan/xylan/chitin deacetylase (PgdA/CDA1 family)
LSSVVLRGFSACVVALVLLGLSFGGGSEAFVRGADDPEIADLPEPRTADAQPAAEETAPLAAPAREPEYPRFVHARNSERRSGAGRVRELLLSFDDGPDLLGTPMVLEALDRYGHKGIFFVNGRYLLGRRSEDLARRDLVRKLAAHGHLVANHTLTHRNLCRVPSAMAEEIDTNSEIIAYATGIRPLLFRSPYGARCRLLDQALRERDLIQVGWNLDPQEWRAADQEKVFDYVTQSLARLNGRAILLLHDTHPAAVRALPRILAWIDQENARVARQGGIPIRVVDYSVFVPEHPLPPTGLEPFVAHLRSTVSVLPTLR